MEKDTDALSCTLCLIGLFLFGIAWLRPSFASPITLIIIGAVFAGLALIAELLGKKL
jgi:divalent metal cation (Fe/Co/Zn/Cd) transporter